MRAILVGTPVSEVMSAKLLTASRDDSLYDVARIMRERRISGLPVVGPDRALLGIISERDLVRELHRAAGVFSFRGILDLLLALEGQQGLERLLTAVQHLKRARVEDAMTRQPVTVDASDSLSEAIRLMGQFQVNRLPVVSKQGLVGIITRTDAFGAIADRIRGGPRPSARVEAPTPPAGPSESLVIPSAR